MERPEAHGGVVFTKPKSQTVNLDDPQMAETLKRFEEKYIQPAIAHARLVAAEVDRALTEHLKLLRSNKGKNE